MERVSQTSEDLFTKGIIPDWLLDTTAHFEANMHAEEAGSPIPNLRIF